MSTSPSKTQVYPEQKNKGKTRRGSVKPQLTLEQEREVEQISIDHQSQIPLMTKPVVQEKTKQTRFDSSGNQIVKGSKKHKITFKRNIKEIIIVENWKIYNMDTEEDENTCPCQLI